MRGQLTAPVSDQDAPPAQPPRLLLPTVRSQLPIRPHHPPPREAETVGKDVADSPGGARISRAPSDFTVANHLSPPDVPDDRRHRLDERPLLCHAPRSR